MSKLNKKVLMPIQPIIKGRFVENRIVSMLLDIAPTDLNKIAIMNFSDQEQAQFAQLIGYSLSGFGDLSYVDDETYNRAESQAGECDNWWAGDQGMSKLSISDIKTQAVGDTVTLELKIGVYTYPFSITKDDSIKNVSNKLRNLASSLDYALQAGE